MPVPSHSSTTSEMQGGGGVPNRGPGQHAIYLYNSENASYANRPIIVNNYAIRGGGGAGGVGGQGGPGGGATTTILHRRVQHTTSVPPMTIRVTMSQRVAVLASSTSGGLVGMHLQSIRTIHTVALA